ncbi:MULTISPECIES: hypothetical protein [unclassified Streptomyces]
MLIRIQHLGTVSVVDLEEAVQIRDAEEFVQHSGGPPGSVPVL